MDSMGNVDFIDIYLEYYSIWWRETPAVASVLTLLAGINLLATN